jgi:pimeloyl-ACP methyl ester carboxylesterase
MANRQKPPILLIHGACSQPAHMEPWRAYFAAAGYRCVVPALPGHAPSDVTLLRRLGIEDYFAAVREVFAGFDRPPIVIGHSMGGLLAQMLGGSAECAALVLVGTIPTGRIPAPLRAIPFFLRVGPRVLAGLPFRASRAGLRRLTLHDLSVAEQDEILPDFVTESGLAYRQMLFGKARVHGRSVACPVLVVNGDADRLVPPSVAREVARKYKAKLILVPGHGHWLIAGSLVGEVATKVASWLETVKA